MPDISRMVFLSGSQVIILILGLDNKVIKLFDLPFA